MLYEIHEWQRSLLGSMSFWAQASAKALTEQHSLFSQLPGAQRFAAGYELMYRLGKDYEKPEFGITQVERDGAVLAISERIAEDRPFCQLRHFQRYATDAEVLGQLEHDPVVLVVAPLSGHHATLLRDTVRTLLPEHDVYITDWVDARMVPASVGGFGLDDYVGYVEDFIRLLGAERLHVISVCQPTVPVLAAASLMAARGETTPLTLTLMGGPIDPRESPTDVNSLATTRPLSWFEDHVIHTVPANYPGHGRPVYPGFLQHAGFVAMNPGRHVSSHWDFYQNLLRGDLNDAAQHRRFYDEYNAVLDMPAEFYLDTIEIVFQEFLLARGLWKVKGEPVKPASIRRSALLTIEGELDDISGLGQTAAAHALCTGIPKRRHQHEVIADAGHYGIFSGRRWRETVYPIVRDFIRRQPSPAR
ncbi:polyhydroxyalkanoate depolymerase [Frateuria aurantia]